MWDKKQSLDEKSSQVLIILDQMSVWLWGAREGVGGDVEMFNLWKK